MGKVNKHSKMVRTMKEIGLMIKSMEKEYYILVIIKSYTKDNGWKIFNLVVVVLFNEE